jgi:uncharacterized RDD family membrane protein YckC
MEQKPAGDPSGDMQKPSEYILTPPSDSNPPPPPAAATPTAQGPVKYCPNCGTPNPVDSVFCHKCGARLPESAAPDKKICAGCGAQNALTAEYCYKCGLKLPETAGVFQVVKYGGFWVRLLANLIDGVLTGVVSGIFTAPFSAGFFQKFADYTSSPSYKPGDGLPVWYWQYVLLSLLISTVIQLAYQTIAVGKWGKTVGKAALGLKVVKPDGAKVSLMRALGRALAFELNAFTMGLSFLLIAFSHKKRGLHDYIADTIVIKTN